MGGASKRERGEGLSAKVKFFRNPLIIKPDVVVAPNSPILCLLVTYFYVKLSQKASA